MKIRSEDHAPYRTDTVTDEDRLIKEALKILEKRLRHPTLDIKLESPDDAKRYLTLHLAEMENECFATMFLNTRHTLIEYRVMFTGTVDAASVHVRPIIQHALKINATALILAHNHPSGDPTPSMHDHTLTKRMREACGYFDMRVLDHMIVGGSTVYSLAENGDL